MKSIFESLANGLRLSDYEDWLTFDGRLSQLVHAGAAKRVPTLKVLHMSDEEWYADPTTGEVYVYVRPDDKILPVWERVDVFSGSFFHTATPSRSRQLGTLPNIRSRVGVANYSPTFNQ